MALSTQRGLDCFIELGFQIVENVCQSVGFKRKINIFCVHYATKKKKEYVAKKQISLERSKH